MDTGTQAGAGWISGTSVSVGDVLGGRYRVTARIGAGGMATIYRAVDESLERVVAVKVLHPHLAEDASFLARFRVEARSAAALLHPHIVTVFDQGTALLPYIVLEHVDGPSLRDVLNGRGRLPPAETLAVVEPVCAALVRAHAGGVVHRDVKPENVLVAADGTPKVADFGIARAVAETSVTQTGMLVGSVHYLAPELVEGQPATPASDQYAVGVLTFELLTGRKPLPADTPMAVALRHAREAVPAPSRYAPDVSKGLDRVVARATATDPRKRFADVAALAAALREAVPSGPAPVVVPARDGNDHGHDTLVVPADAAETVSVAAAEELAGRRTRPRRARRWLVRLVLVGLLLATLASGAYGVWDQLVAPVTAVPPLVGRSQADALAALNGAGFGLVVAQDTTHSLTVPEGAVAAQVPAADVGLRRGGDVTVTLSAGPAVVTMPGVLGVSQDEALATLRAEPYAFDVRVDEAFTETGAPAGTVQAQLPAPGEELRAGSEVVVNVSLGVEQVTVPDLSGATREEAERRLAGAKLAATFEEAYSDEVPHAGRVVSQSPTADATVDKGATVTVTISKGPVTFELPRVEGEAVGDAVARLEALGLDVAVHEERRPRIGPFVRGRFGRVEVQDPAAGTAVRRGQRVDLYTFSERAEDD
jgi:beta-lactam-binding protein with PASTA domain